MVSKVVNHEHKHAHLPIAWMLWVIVASNHAQKVADDSPGGKKCTIHPSSPLLHQDRQCLWGIGKCLGVWYICQIVSGLLLDVYLQTHDSVFGQVLIGLTAWGISLLVHQLEEGVHWPSLNSLPSEHTVCSWQHRVIPKKALASLIWRMTKFVLIKLCTPHQIWRVVFKLGEIYLDFSTAASTVLVFDHVLVQLGNGIIIWSCSNVEHQAKLWFEVLTDALEKPLVTVDFSIVSLL